MRSVFLLCFGLSSVAFAQSPAPLDSQLFNPTTGEGYFGVVSADTLQPTAFRFGAFLNFASDPVEVFNSQEDQVVLTPVQNQMTLDLVGAVGIKLLGELGVAVPVALVQNGDELGPLGGNGAISGGKLGDMRLTYKRRLLRASSFTLSANAQLKLPTGNEENFTGSGAFPFLVGLASEVKGEKATVGATAAFSSRPSVSFADLTLSNELRLGLGGSYPITPKALATAELEGAVSLDPGSRGHVPAEARLGARLNVAPDLWLPIGAGVGLSSSIGAPDFRLFTGLVYSPTPADPDADGIKREADACPVDPEDKDGFEDENGCPDTDNDQDQIADASDSCPDEIEDKDGIGDTDGCPELDNDKDTFADTDDQCPDEAETFGSPSDKGSEDGDGCPDAAAVITTEKIKIKDKIYFDLGKSTLRRESYTTLNAVAEVLKKHPDVKIRIEGHTDDLASDEINQSLSSGRAEAVLEYLVKKGVPRDQLEAVGYGESRPVALVDGLGGEELEKAREQNRRVEFATVE